MSNKNLELLIKLNEKYGLNNELIETKKQLRKTVREKRTLEEELAREHGTTESSIREWFINCLDAVKELFRKKSTVVKELRVFYSKQYKHAVEQFELGFLSAEELNVLIRNDVVPNYRIWQLQKEIDLQAKQDIYYAVVKNDKSILIEFLEAAKNDLLILNEELKRTEKLKVYDADALRSKNNKINRLTGRITKVEKEIESIKTALEQSNTKEKRPVGRPKGSTKKQNL